MATLQVIRCPRSVVSKAEVVKGTNPDSDTLATALGTHGLALVFDPAKVEHEEAFHKMLAKIRDVIQQAPWPPS